MVKKGTPARVEPAGSFLPVVPEEGQEESGEAAGSAAAHPTATSQVEGAEAAGSAAAKATSRTWREGEGLERASIARKTRRSTTKPKISIGSTGELARHPESSTKTRLGSIANNCWTTIQLALLLWALRTSGGGRRGGASWVRTARGRRLCRVSWSSYRQGGGNWIGSFGVRHCRSCGAHPTTARSPTAWVCLGRNIAIKEAGLAACSSP